MATECHLRLATNSNRLRHESAHQRLTVHTSEGRESMCRDQRVTLAIQFVWCARRARSGRVYHRASAGHRFGIV